MKKKPLRIISTSSGLTIVEILVALGIVGLGFAAFVSGFVALKNFSQKTSVSSTFDRQINEICGNIKAGIENYQVNFNFKDSASQEALNAEALPMAWDVDIISTKKECPQCQGSFGYTIQPLESMRGLYSVQVRFAHKSWGKMTKDFSFVVSVK